MKINYLWTNGRHKDFQMFYQITGGTENRKAFIPFNVLESIHDVLLAYVNDTVIACAGLKPYSERDVEVKRVWVEPKYRENHIASELMNHIEERARSQGFQRTILQTREIMTDAVQLYKKLGYDPIQNYPPYDRMAEAVCFAKDITI